MTARTFLPKASYMPWRGEYRPTYRWYRESNWTLVPGGKSYPSAAQAIAAADEFLAKGLNPPIRTEQAPEPEPDALNTSGWHVDRAAREAERQERMLGGVIARGGKLVMVERR